MEPGNWILKKTYLSQAPKGGGNWLAIYTLAIFLVISIIHWSDLFGLSSHLTASHQQIFEQNEYWRLFSTIAVHDNMEHLLGNGLFFVPFAAALYGYFGVLIFPVLSLCAGALINFLTLWFYPPHTSLLGASGVVYFMAAFWLVIYIRVARQYSLKNRLLRGIGLALAELAPQAFDPQVSYASHAIGFVFGITCGLVYFYYFKTWFRFKEQWILEEIPVAEDLESGLPS